MPPMPAAMLCLDAVPVVDALPALMAAGELPPAAATADLPLPAPAGAMAD